MSGEGLKPSSERVHIAYRQGKRTVTPGPFTGATELPAGFTLMSVRSKEEALAWCDKFAAARGGDVELYLGAVVEPWDLGFEPKPADPALRFLALHQADERSERDAPPANPAKLDALVEEMTKAGALQAAGALASTRKGARVRFQPGGHSTVIDGPFAESKELVAGYAILELPSKEEAVRWAIRFGEVVQVNEVEVRLMA